MTQDHDPDAAIGASGRWQQFVAAISLLTRLPVAAAGGGVAATSWAFPLVGGLIGLCGGAVFALAGYLGIGTGSAVLLAIGTQVALTGALHEDGLADTADGFGGGRDREAKLAIMRDSRIGTYGVLALLLVVGLRFSAIQEIAWSLLSMTDEVADTVSDATAVTIALVICGAASRAAMTVFWHSLPSARSEGLAANAGSVPAGAALQAVLIAAAFGAILLSWLSFLAVLGAVAVTTLAFRWLVIRQIQGHTGDTLGACQQLTEVAALLALAATVVAV